MSKALTSALLLLALAACGKSEDWSEPKAPTSTAVGQPPANKAVQRTILNMVVAGSIDAKGIPVGEASTFAPDQPQITVIARVGKVAEGSSIRFAWYQETDDEDEPLFDQTVKVASFDRAYSEGKNSGILAAGMYKVTATLGDDVREIEFTVAPLSGKSTPRTASAVEFDWLSALGVKYANAEQSASRRVNWRLAQNKANPASNAVSEAEPGQPPVAGASGVVSAVRALPNAPAHGQGFVIEGVGEAWVVLRDYSTDRIAGRVEYGVIGLHADQLSRLSTSMNGSTVARTGYLDDIPDVPEYDIDPCTLPRGSDLPGTKIDVTSTYTASQQPPVIYTGVITLGHDTLPPPLHVDSVPPKNTKVKAGQDIDITVTASEKRTGGPWQTGVQMIKVTDANGRDVGKPAINPSKDAQACNKKTWGHIYKTTYTVPKNPPDVIKLCAHAQDYAGNKREKCAKFPTHDLFTYYEWEGDIKKEFVQQYDIPPTMTTGKWMETFHVKFVQVPTSSIGTYTHKDGTDSHSYKDDFYPLALDYTLVPTYTQIGGNRRIDVSGSATGHLRGNTLLKKPSGQENWVPETDLNNDPGRESKTVRLPALKGMHLGGGGDRLSGEILRIAGDHPGNAGQEEKRNSDAEECAFYGDLPGDFRLTIDLGAQGGSTVSWTDQEKQALLRGIEISGNFDGRKADGPGDVSQFNQLIRADICGRILRADQKQVTGHRSYEVKESGGIPGQQGRITWNFRRTAKQIAYEKK
jgi:hypothetical protein